MPAKSFYASRRCIVAALAWLCWAGAGAVAAEANARNALPMPQGEVLLTVRGAIERANVQGTAQFDRAMLEALPRMHITTHTSVTDGAHAFEGFLMRDLLARVGATGSTVTATALNDYMIEFAMDEFTKYDVIVAWAMDGKILHVQDKGPLWIVYPRDQHRELQDIRYDYRWVWQLRRLDVR